MPTYSLDVIHQMAREPDKIFLSRLAQRDSLNLGYGMTDIVGCIGALQPSNFLNTQNYNGIILDAYRILYSGPSGNVDDLYIKLRLTADQRLAISITSFHL